MTSNPTQRLIQLEDLIPETNVVATIRQDVETISNQNNLKFQESYDDLDFLVFAILPLLQTSRVALISHKNAPVPGIEICVRYDEENIVGVISETLKSLKLTPEDLIWIDSQYEREFYLNLAPLSILNSFSQFVRSSQPWMQGGQMPTDNLIRSSNFGLRLNREC